jgi:hypothetical protein
MEVTFWNAAEYGILCGNDLISAEFCEISFFNSAEFHLNSAEFHAISCMEFHMQNLGSKFMEETLDFLY